MAFALSVGTTRQRQFAGIDPPCLSERPDLLDEDHGLEDSAFHVIPPDFAHFKLGL
jgi:hypothetical protein